MRRSLEKGPTKVREDNGMLAPKGELYDKSGRSRRRGE